MSKKAKGIIKFFVACGVVVSAVLAVVAILYRMRAKLNQADVVEGDEEGLCDGSCEGCTMCGDVADEDEAEDTEIEAEAEADVNE